MNLIKHIICIHDILKKYRKYSIILINSFYLDIKVQYIPAFSFQLIRSAALQSPSRGMPPFSFAVVYQVAFVGAYKHQPPIPLCQLSFLSYSLFFSQVLRGDIGAEDSVCILCFTRLLIRSPTLFPLHCQQCPCNSLCSKPSVVSFQMALAEISFTTDFYTTCQ